MTRRQCETEFHRNHFLCDVRFFVCWGLNFSLSGFVSLRCAARVAEVESRRHCVGKRGSGAANDFPSNQYSPFSVSLLQISEYYKLKSELRRLDTEIRAMICLPINILPFLQAGRLAYVNRPVLFALDSFFLLTPPRVFSPHFFWSDSR